MTVVMGFAELLMSGEAPERKGTWLRHIYEDSKRVIDIVDDLLNVSRIQSGKISFQVESIDVCEVLTDAVERLRPTSIRHQLTVDVAPSVPNLLADRNKLAQVTTNLLSNAIKYSPNGGPVTLSAGHDAPANRIVLSVTDPGIGIAQKDQERLFKTFQRIQHTETRGIRGTGLGLYIVKGLVELMGGTVWLESELSRGSTFFVGLPTEQAGAEGKG